MKHSITPRLESSPPLPGEVDPVVWKRHRVLGLLQAPHIALWMAFILFFNPTTFKPGCYAQGVLNYRKLLNCTLFKNLLFNYLLPLYCLNFLQDSGGGLGEIFPLWFNIIIHNDYIWSFCKFLIILSDWCMVICIGYLVEYSFCSTTYI